jgi:FkbM family methyltransferase
MTQKKYYEETGIFTDWNQLNRLPKVDTLVDIGVGPNGTQDLYGHFPTAKLILIDPLVEARNYFEHKLKRKNSEFHLCALGEEDDVKINLKVQDNMACTSLLEVADFNYIENIVDSRSVTMCRLDTLLANRSDLGSIGIKIDVEGFELNVLRGSVDILKQTDFVLAEVRHNHESFKGVYGLSDFVRFMNRNGFVLSIIFTAKPFIADLGFVKENKLNEKVS